MCNHPKEASSNICLLLISRDCLVNTALAKRVILLAYVFLWKKKEKKKRFESLICEVNISIHLKESQPFLTYTLL